MRQSHWISIAVALACLSEPALAQRRGGGGGFRGGAAPRAISRPSVSRPAFNPGNSGMTVNRANVNRTDINRTDIDATVRRPINVNDVDVHTGDYRNDYGCCYHPVARGVAAGTAAAVTAAAIGSVAYALPSNCTVVVVNGVTYDQCGSAWYQPQFEGTTTTYVVVSPPQ